MPVFAIGDLHLSLGVKKPMDVFSGWSDYVPRLEKAWKSLITSDDTVVIDGDISWGMSFEQSLADFAFLEALPGKKVLVKGNHDYWWNTSAKMKRWFAENKFESFEILHNNCVFVDDIALCGTRGWLYDIGQPHDEKVMNREVLRLKASLNTAGDAEKVAFLHYPPIYPNASAEDIVAVMHEYGVKRCFYGHLHGASIQYAVQGNVDGIEYKLISADALQFCPIKI